MSYFKPGKRLRFFAAVLMLVASNSSVWAADYTWQLGGVTRDWEDPANWDTPFILTLPGDIPASSEVLFSGAAPGDVNLGIGRTIESLSFNGTGGYTLNNFSLDLPAGNTLSQGGSGVNVVNTQINAANLASVVSGGTLQLNNVNNAITGSFTVSGSGNLAASAPGVLGSANVSLTGGTFTVVGPAVNSGLTGNYWSTPGNPDTASFNSLGAFNSTIGASAPTAVSDGAAFPNSFDFSNAGFGENPPFGEAGVNIGADNVVARWSGFYTPTGPGTVNFFTRSDDGTMLFIDGQLVVNNNFYQGATTRGGVFTFNDTDPHQMDVLFYEGGGGAGATVSQGSDGNLIPKSQLTSATGTAPTLTNPINVSANSTIAGQAGTLGGTTGPVTINRGLQLTTSGQVGSQSITATGAGAAPVTINAADGTYSVPGLSDGGNAANFVKAGSGTVKLTGTAATLQSNSQVRVDGGTLSVQSGLAGNSLGSAPVQLNGGTLNLQGRVENVPGLLTQNWYINQGNGSVDLHNGGLSTAAAVGSNILGGALNFGTDGAFASTAATPQFGAPLQQFDNFQFKWNGTLHSNGESFTFGVGNAGAVGLDDDMSVYVNLDHSVDASGNPTYTSDEQLMRNGCCGAFTSGTTAIPAGDYDFAIGFAEGGGGNSIGATFSVDGGATFNIINPGTQSDRWSTRTLGTANFAGNALEVTANSNLSVTNSRGAAEVGAITIHRGAGLTTSGDLNTPSISSASGAGAVTIDTTSGTVTTASLNDAFTATSFIKTGAGNLRLTNNASDIVAAGSTVTINQGRLSAVADAAGSSLGAAPVTLSGGTLNVSTAGSVNGLIATVYNNTANTGITTENLGGTFGVQNGPLTPNVQVVTTTLSGALNYPQDADQSFRTIWGGQPANDIFAASFTGTFVATTSGAYQFAATGNDDTAVIWIDRDHDGVFSHSGAAGDEMIQAVGCCNNTGVASVNLPAGDYKIAFAVEDTGGGSGLVANFADPGGALHVVNPSAEPGRFLAEVGSANFSATNVLVTANSAIEGGAAAGGAVLGNTTINRGATLTTSGQLNLASVAAAGAGASSVGLNVVSGTTSLGKLSDGGATATFVKSGAGEAKMTGAQANTFNAAATVNVQAGTLSVTNSAAGVTTLASGANNAHVVLSGGTLNVNAVATATLEPGLVAQFYDRGPLNAANTNQDPSLNRLSTFNGVLQGLTPATTAVVPSVNFASTDGASFASAGYNGVDNITARFSGKIFISAAQAADPNGVILGTESDDGSVIFIDGQDVPVVDNNQYQGMTVRGSAVFGLTEGYHDIVIGFYEGGGGAGVIAGWVDNGNQVPLPAEVLFHEVFGTTPVGYNNTVRVTANSTLSSNGVVGSAFGPLTMDAGITLTKNGTQDSTFTSTSLRGSSTFDVATGSLTLGGTTDNTNTTTLTKVGAGTLVLNSSVNDFNGTDLVVNGGALALSGGGGLNTAKSLTVNNGGAFDIRDAALVANVPVKMNPGSALTVSSASGSVANLLYNGGSFNGPVLSVTSSLGGVGNLDATKVALSDSTIVAPGNPGVNDSTGTLTVIGDFAAPANGALAIQIAGRDADQYDHFAVNGTYAPAGTLAVTLVNGFQPNTGDLFSDVYSASSLVGGFLATSGLNLGNNLFLNRVSTPTSVGLLAAQPGDADLNRTTDFSDLGTLLNNFNQPAGFGAGEWALGDFNDDHNVDFTDLGILLNNFGQTTPLVASTNPVPEPSSMVLLSLGLLGMALVAVRARRRQG